MLFSGLLFRFKFVEHLERPLKGDEIVREARALGGQGGDLLIEHGEILARGVDTGLDLHPLGLEARSTKTEAG